MTTGILHAKMLTKNEQSCGGSREADNISCVLQTSQIYQQIFTLDDCKMVLEDDL